MTSDAFRRFEEDFLSEMTPARGAAGVDVAALHRLPPDERARAEELLLQRLHEAPTDVRAVIGLGELRSVRALPQLRERMPDAGLLATMETWPRGLATPFIRVAVALWQIEADVGALRYLVDLLARLPHHSGRLNAAMALRHVRCREAVRALRAALDDPSDLVRYQAMSSLLAIYGLWEEGTRAHPWASAMMSPDASRRAEAIEALGGAIDETLLPACL